MYEAELKEPSVKSSAATLPKVTGYRILIAMPMVKEKTSGGIIQPEELLRREHTAAIVGNVIDMGPDCYLDYVKFPNGPYCKRGDWVIFRSYSGTRIKIKNQEFRLINDDCIEAVVEDPREIERA